MIIPRSLRHEETFPLPGDVQQSLIPDGYFEVATPLKTLAAFLEVDLGHEGLLVWKGKVQKYLRYMVSGAFESTFHEPGFRVLVVTNSDRRLMALRRVTATITDKVFWFTTTDSIHREGFWSPIWFRPRGDHEPISLIPDLGLN